MGGRPFERVSARAGSAAASNAGPTHSEGRKAEQAARRMLTHRPMATRGQGTASRHSGGGKRAAKQGGAGAGGRVRAHRTIELSIAPTSVTRASSASHLAGEMAPGRQCAYSAGCRLAGCAASSRRSGVASARSTSLSTASTAVSESAIVFEPR